jgi:hypothetical protein
MKALACNVVPINGIIVKHILKYTYPKGRFTLWPKVKRASISTNQIARNQEFGLKSMAKVQRLSQFKMITFCRRRLTLEGSLGRTGMETQTIVERPSVFFH